jgi:molecular chaperone GrpE
MMEQSSEEAKTTTPEEVEGTPVSTATEVEATVSRLQSDLKEKTAEVEALNDRLLRLHAEFENYKKRMARERSEFMKFANEALILGFLPILDNLERAVATAKSGRDAQGVAEGLDIICRLFQTTLEKAGVKAIEALEHEFDPNLHQAVAQVESIDGRDNLVVEEVQKGYLLEGRLLRPTMVRVSKVKVPRSEFQVPGSAEDQPGTWNLEHGTSDA